MTSGSLWNYYRVEVNDDANDNASNRLNKNKTLISKSFEYKTKITGSMSNNNNILDAEVVVPVKYVINFWISLGLSFIICEIELDFFMVKKLYNF